MNEQYASLRKVFDEAFEQAAQGKGHQRHAQGELPFEQQELVRELVEEGLGPARYQIRKKARETRVLEGKAVDHELFGVMVIAAAAVLARREAEGREWPGPVEVKTREEFPCVDPNCECSSFPHTHPWPTTTLNDPPNTAW